MCRVSRARRPILAATAGALTAPASQLGWSSTGRRWIGRATAMAPMHSSRRRHKRRELACGSERFRRPGSGGRSMPKIRGRRSANHLVLSAGRWCKLFVPAAAVLLADRVVRGGSMVSAQLLLGPQTGSRRRRASVRDALLKVLLSVERRRCRREAEEDWRLAPLLLRLPCQSDYLGQLGDVAIDHRTFDEKTLVTEDFKE